MAVPIKGTRKSGTLFSGDLVALQASRLILQDKAISGPVQWGIPIEDIRELQLPIDSSMDLFPALIEDWIPLLPLWDDATRSRMTKILEQAAGKEDWSRVHKWTSSLLNAFPQGPEIDQLKLIRAWALYELGLIEEAGRQSRDLADSMDPMKAPSRLCWLMAHLCGDLSESLAWARLPALQIPSQKGPLARELASRVARHESPTR
jgi:hypothetical protein